MDIYYANISSLLNTHAYFICTRLLWLVSQLNLSGISCLNHVCSWRIFSWINARFTKVGSLLRCILHQLLLTQLFSQHFVNYIRIRRKRYFLLKKKYLFSEALLEFHAKNGREKGRGTETIETCSGNCLLAKDSSNFCWKFNLDGDHVALFRVQ